MVGGNEYGRLVEDALKTLSDDNAAGLHINWRYQQDELGAPRPYRDLTAALLVETDEDVLDCEDSASTEYSGSEFDSYWDAREAKVKRDWDTYWEDKDMPTVDSPEDAEKEANSRIGHSEEWLDMAVSRLDSLGYEDAGQLILDTANLQHSNAEIYDADRFLDDEENGLIESLKDNMLSGA